MIMVIPHIQFKTLAWWYTVNILLCQHTAFSSCILFPSIDEPQFSLLKSLALDVCILSLWSVSLSLSWRENSGYYNNYKQTTCCIFEHISVSLGDIFFLKWNCWAWVFWTQLILVTKLSSRKHVQIYILIFAHC